MPNPSTLKEFLSQHGRVSSLEELQALVGDFESTLNGCGIAVKPKSHLERACLAVFEALAKHQDPNLRSGSEDSRALFAEVLGIWALMKLVVSSRHHPTFPQFVPHLALLNKGQVVQNTQLRMSDEASNKIFELLFALVLLSVGDRLVLDHPSLAQGDNPDILVSFEGKRWGFALKTVYGQHPKTFFDNLKKGVQQIEHCEAEIGCVVVNFRNLIDHNQFLPIMNPEEYAAGADPDFGGYVDPEVIRDKIRFHVTAKEHEVRQEIGEVAIRNLFSGMKAIPGFAAYFQTRAKRLTPEGAVPSDICSLGLGRFEDLQAHIPLFERINLALHQRIQLGEQP